MNAVFNGNLLNLSSLSFDIHNRAFLYGDGLFETIIVTKGEIGFLEDHLDRLHRGMKIFKMKIPLLLTHEEVQRSIKALLEANQLETARIKLMVWRKPGGLFIPESEDADFLISSKEFEVREIPGRKVDFCASVTLQESIFSEFKRLNCLPYILAGIESKEKGLDDLIILDDHGHISECISSNVFWKVGNEYFTPALNTGCIAGVRRKNLIKRFSELSVAIHQVNARPDELLSADHIFSVNVAGFYPIIQVGKNKFPAYIPSV